MLLKGLPILLLTECLRYGVENGFDLWSHFSFEVLTLFSIYLTALYAM